MFEGLSKERLEVLRERFWSRVDKSGGPDACWLWVRCLSRAGYGRLSLKNRLYLAHRVAYALTHGGVADSIDVLHKCDHPSCCNPAHLFLGTHKDNMRDMYSKGRHPTIHQMVSDEQVQEILALAESGLGYKEISQRYGIRRHSISLICLGQRRQNTRIIRRQRPHTHITEELAQRIRALRAQGMTFRAIAGEIGADKGTVSDVISGKHKPRRTRQVEIEGDEAVSFIEEEEGEE